MIVTVTILICSVGIQPPDCQRDTAVDVIKGPSAANERECALYGQEFLAGVAELLDPGTYPKITCARTAERGQAADALAD